MPEDKLPISEFAKRIKEKYPVYNDMNDTTLVENVLAKYPQYADMVDVSGLSKKKDSESGGATATAEAKALVEKQETTSTSLPPKQETPGIPASKDKQSPLTVNGLTVPQGLPLHNFNKLMGSQQPDYGQINIEANKKVNDMSGRQNEDPLSHIYGSVMSPDATTHDKAVASRAAKIVRDKLLPDGYEAKKMLATTHYGNKNVNNITATEIRNRADKYDKTTAPLREIPTPQEPYDNNDNVKNAYMDLLQNAAIKWYAGEHSDFRKELGNAHVDIKDPDLAHRISSAKAGQILNIYLNNKDVMTYLKKENPKLITAYEYAAKQNINKNTEYGINDVATEVSQAIQKSGYNNIDPIFNFDTDASRKYANTIAEGLFKDDPDKLAIYNKHIRDNQHKYLDKPSLVESVAGGIEDVFGGVKRTLEVPFTNRDERQQERWAEEASTVSADPKGLMSFLRNTGKATGFVMGLAAGGEVGEGVGFSTGTAQKVMAGFTFFGDEFGGSEEKYKNPLLAFTDASIKTGMFMVMSDIFPAAKAKAAWGEIKPEVETVIENLTAGNITKEAARKELHALSLKGIATLGAKAVAQNTKMSLEMTALTGTDQMLDRIFGLNDDEFNKHHPSGELLNTFTGMFTANGVVSAMAARGEMRRENKIFDNSIYKAASNPLQTWRAIENAGVKDPSLNVTEMFDNLTFIANTKIDLDNIKNKKGQPLTEKEKSDYLAASLKERVMQKQIDKMPDATMQRAHGDDLRYQKEVKDNILKGEPGHPTVVSAVVEINGKEYEGKNHAEALLKARDAGEDITKVDRQAEGKFKLSDGTIIDRSEAMNRFGRDRSETMIPQDEAANKANEEYKKIGEPAVVEKTPEEIATEKGIPGEIGNLLKAGTITPEQGVLEIAKQLRGVSDHGEDLGEGQPITAFEKFDPELMKAVEKKFPDKKSVVDAIKKPEDNELEAKKSDIEKRRQQEIQYAKTRNFQSDTKTESDLKSEVEEINDKYDAELKKLTDEAEQKPAGAVEPVKAEEKVGADKEPDKTGEPAKEKDKPLVGQTVEADVHGTKIKGVVTEDDGSGMVTIKKDGTDFEMTVDRDAVKPVETKPELKTEPEMKKSTYGILTTGKEQVLNEIADRYERGERWPNAGGRAQGALDEYPGLESGRPELYKRLKNIAEAEGKKTLAQMEAEATPPPKRKRYVSKKKTGPDPNQPIETKQPQDADGPTPQPKNNVDEFNKNVDDVASAVKDWMKKVKLISDLPEGTQKSGIGLEDLVDKAAGIVKQAYILGNDIKLAIEKAIQHIYQNWDKAWGDFNDFEKEFRRNFARINPNVGQAMTKQEIQQLLDASRANNPKFLERAKDYAKRSPIARLAVSTVRTFDPFVGGSKSTPSIYNDARLTAILLRKSLGKMQHANEVASQQSDEFTRYFEGMDEADRVMFITNIERGIDMGDKKLNEVADHYRKRMENVFESIKAIKDVPYIEDYFPHFWADPEAARRVFAKSAAKNPMEGSKSFLRARFYSDIVEGMKDGLQLVSTNPEDLVRLAEINAYKFTMAHDFFNALKDKNLAKFFTAGNQPEGWGLVDDPLFKRVIPTEAGAILSGGWYMPHEASEIVKRYSSRGLKGPFVDTIRGFNNMLNQAQLGISFFHGMTTTIDAAVTADALGIDKIMRGKIGTGLWDLGTGVTVLPNLVRTYRVGNKAIKDFRSGVINKNVEMMMAANARTGVDVIYRTDMVEKFKRAWAGNQYGKVVLRAVPAAFDYVAKPIFELLVPRLKVGGMIRVAENELSKLKNPNQEQIDRTIQKVWDDMENRLGQMTYDNLFWNKTTKDIAFLATRSVGWNLGTIRAFAEGAADLPKSFATGVTGKGISPRTAWTMALVGQTALMGAITTYIMTGQPPQDWRDYFYPRTGGKDKNGNDKRIQYPTYMKEVFNTYQRGVVHELEAKMSPLINQTIEPIQNQDFYGNMVRDPLDPAWKQGLDVLKYEAEQLVPLAFRTQPGEKPSTAEKLVKGIGITPAPQYVIRGKDLSRAFQKLKDVQADLRDLRKKWKKGEMSDDKYTERFEYYKNIEQETIQELNDK